MYTLSVSSRSLLGVGPPTLFDTISELIHSYDLLAHIRTHTLHVYTSTHPMDIIMATVLYLSSLA